MKLFFCVHATPLCLFFLLDSNGTRVATNILAGSHGNMRPAALRVSSSPGRPSPTQDFGTSRSRPLSPVKTSGFSSSMSSQTSPALVNALFERVEQQAEVCVIYIILEGRGWGIFWINLINRARLQKQGTGCYLQFGRYM